MNILMKINNMKYYLKVMNLYKFLQENIIKIFYHKINLFLLKIFMDKLLHKFNVKIVIIPLLYHTLLICYN